MKYRIILNTSDDIISIGYITLDNPNCIQVQEMLAKEYRRYKDSNSSRFLEWLRENRYDVEEEYIQDAVVWVD